MNERYMRCKQCGVMRRSGESLPCTGPFEILEVWPEGTVARLREAVTSLASSLQGWLDQDECDCGPEGHICGRPQLLKDIEAARAALAATEVQG